MGIDLGKEGQGYEDVVKACRGLYPEMGFSRRNRASIYQYQIVTLKKCYL